MLINIKYILFAISVSSLQSVLLADQHTYICTNRTCMEMPDCFKLQGKVEEWTGKGELDRQITSGD